MPIRWTPPPHNIYKLNIDSNGNQIDGFSNNIVATTPIQAEIIALLKGLELAFRKNRIPLIVETDCQVLISLSQQKYDSKSYVNLPHDRGFLLDGNQVARTIAKYESTWDSHPNAECGYVIWNEPPLFVSLIFHKDYLGTTSFRSVPCCNDTPAFNK